MCSALLEYSPKKRFTAWDSLTHTFFDELRNPDTRLPNKQPLPELFNFTDRELKYNPSKNSLLLAKSGGEGVVAGEGSGSASKEWCSASDADHMKSGQVDVFFKF